MQILFLSLMHFSLLKSSSFGFVFHLWFPMGASAWNCGLAVWSPAEPNLFPASRHLVTPYKVTALNCPGSALSPEPCLLPGLVHIQPNPEPRALKLVPVEWNCSSTRRFPCGRHWDTITGICQFWSRTLPSLLLLLAGVYLTIYKFAVQLAKVPIAQLKFLS